MPQKGEKMRKNRSQRVRLDKQRPPLVDVPAKVLARSAGHGESRGLKKREIFTQFCRGEHVDSNGENRILLSHSVTEI